MTHLIAIILGFIEGLTEFIPISSSGHLIIAREIFGQNGVGGLAFDAVLQLATSCALLVYFWKDVQHLILKAFNLLRGKVISEKDKTMLYAVVLGTIPAVIAGLLLEKQMETIFRNVHLVALTLILGSLLMWFANRKKKENKELSLRKGIIVGLYQCLALVPGISRSGATISGGLLEGLTQEESVRFSFLLSLPILFGAGLKKLFEVRHELFTTGFGSSILLGSIVAFITGLVSIHYLIKYLKTHNLNVFVLYRVVLAVLILVLL